MLLGVGPGPGDGTGRQPEELVAREDVVGECQAAVQNVRHVGQRHRFPHPSVRDYGAFRGGAVVAAACGGGGGVQDLVQL